MSQTDGKFLKNDSVTDDKARLRNNQPLRSRNAANSADINILKVDAGGIVQLLTQTQIATAPSAANDIATKSYVDGASGAGITALTGDVTATGPGSAAASVIKINGASIPVSKTIVGTNGSGQLVDASSATLSNNTSGTAANVTGTVAIANGGTGNTTALAAYNALITHCQEAPSGTINGSNVTFTLANTPAQALSVVLSLDGVILRQGIGLDYTISTATITMASAPAVGQILWAIYVK